MNRSDDYIDGECMFVEEVVCTGESGIRGRRRREWMGRKAAAERWMILYVIGEGR